MVTPDPKDERLEDRSASTESYLEPERSEGRRGAAIRLLALGLNAWLVGIVLPAWGTVSLAVPDRVLIALPPIALLVGLRALLRGDPSALGLLGVAVPVLSVAAIAGRTEAALASYGTATTLFAVASSMAYVVGVAHVLGRPTALRATRETKLAASTRLRPPARALRRAVVATTAILAFVIAVVAPALGSHEALVEQWGEAAGEGRVIAAIVGGAIACIATAIVVGPSLRAHRGRPSRPGEATLTITLSLVVAATGAIAWAILRTVAP